MQRYYFCLFVLAGVLTLSAVPCAARSDTATTAVFERHYPTQYRVKQGETLMSIARRKEIFNDPYLWPLIYKANRDQIRDPSVIFPGQVLTIPRDISPEDMADARRQAGAPAAYVPPRKAYDPELYRKHFPKSVEQNNAAPDNQSSTGK